MVTVFGPGGLKHVFEQEDLDWTVTDEGRLTVGIKNGSAMKKLATYGPGVWTYVMREQVTE